MNSRSKNCLSHLPEEIVSNIKGIKLEAYLIALEGWRRGLVLKWHIGEKYFSLSSKDKTHHFFLTKGDLVSNETVEICKNKHQTKILLEQAKVPTPEWELFKIDEKKAIINYAKEIGYPVVLKPVDGRMGKSVYINHNKKELLYAIKEAHSTGTYQNYLVEKYYPGNEYRIYVVNNKAVVATNRIPANILGDGKKSIKELIKDKNKERKKNPYLRRKLIKLDSEVKNSLRNLGYSQESIPGKGERIFLRQKSNLSTGGDPVEVTDKLTKEVKQIAVEALKALPSMPHGGVDVIVDPKYKKKSVVLEINTAAEISFHCFPVQGKAKDVPKEIIDYYFPETIGQKKSAFYFDLEKALEPLRTGVVNEVKVSQPLMGKLHAKKYVVTGVVNKVGYLNWIRRKALMLTLSGYAKKITNNKVEVFVTSTSKVKVDDFENLCWQGSSRSKVSHVEVTNVDVDMDQSMEIGFKLFL